MATEGTPATADTPGTSRTSKSSRGASNIAGVIATVGTPATADKPKISAVYEFFQVIGNYRKETSVLCRLYLSHPWTDFSNIFSLENLISCSY